MEMENIDENTIRVLIESTDLEERGITFLDLLGNQKQIESFFYSILEEVDVDKQFLETDAITFQVLPKGSGLELFISKANGDDLDSVDGDFDPAEHLLEIMNNHSEKTKTKEILKADDDGVLGIMVKFNDFEHFIELSKHFFIESGQSNLYYYKNDYYLAIDFYIDEMVKTNLEVTIASILEFSEESELSVEFLNEYGQLIMSEDALGTARQYFK